ncbi:hypothetical protein J7L87_02210 [bacterium]|nr:hypothetical protein [bacterium]
MGKKVRYILRKFVPEWLAEKTIDELMRFCKENSIDEVMCFTESAGVYRELLPVEEVKKVAEVLKKVKKALERINVKYSINVLTTIGHGDFGGNISLIHPEVEFMIDYRGKKSKSCACPLSPGWQKLIKETYSIYASTKPEGIWIDDDFRYFYHSPSIEFGCYCERHLETFSKIIGEKINREKLVQLILKPGKPHPLREKWFKFLEDTMIEAGRIIRDTVHKVSPRTRVCWMSSTPYLHEIEGRDPEKQIEALKGKVGSGIRMATTQYYEGNPRFFLIEDEALKKFLPFIPENVLKATEIESMPHSIYVKSARWLSAQIKWGCVLGIENHTLNIYDPLGTPMEIPGVAEMLRKDKKEFNSLLKMVKEGKEFRGINILTHPHSIYYTHTKEGQRMEELYPRESGWTEVLRGFGFPIVYNNSREKVSAITGQILRCFGRKEIEEIFSKGVLLDLSAVETLGSLNLWELAGVRVKGVYHHREKQIGPEELTDTEFGGGKYRFTWTYGVSTLWRVGDLEVVPEARVISRILNPELEFLFNGVVLFENELGGRIAVYPYDFSGASSDLYEKGASKFFYTEYRKLQFHSVIDWLSQGEIPLKVEANGWILPHRVDEEKSITVAAMNINYDFWKRAKFECTVSKRVKRIMLCNKREWKELNRKNWFQKGDKLTVEVRKNIPPLEIIALHISY